jgi:uncharacterized membrane protein YfcA
MIAVFMRNVPLTKLRDTLFVLWFIIVSIKLVTLYLLEVDLNTSVALVLLPAGAVGHVIGLRTHDFLVARDVLCKQLIGLFLIVVSLLGLGQLAVGQTA